MAERNQGKWSEASGPGRFHARVETIPRVAGAYVLLIRLEQPLAVVLPGRAPIPLAAGRYLYCGSARGPGGLQARLARHFQRDKRPRWHVDHLTTAGRVEGAWAFPGGRECDLVLALSGLPVPIPGFGSSDCRTCASHLLAWPDAARDGGDVSTRHPGAYPPGGGAAADLPHLVAAGAREQRDGRGTTQDHAGADADGEQITVPAR